MKSRLCLLMLLVSTSLCLLGLFGGTAYAYPGTVTLGNYSYPLGETNTTLPVGPVGAGELSIVSTNDTTHSVSTILVWCDDPNVYYDPFHHFLPESASSLYSPAVVAKLMSVFANVGISSALESTMVQYFVWEEFGLPASSIQPYGGNSADVNWAKAFADSILNTNYAPAPAGATLTAYVPVDSNGRPVKDTQGFLEYHAPPPVTVPEPTAIMIVASFGLGLVFLGIVRRQPAAQATLQAAA